MNPPNAPQGTWTAPAQFPTLGDGLLANTPVEGAPATAAARFAAYLVDMVCVFLPLVLLAVPTGLPLWFAPALSLAVILVLTCVRGLSGHTLGTSLTRIRAVRAGSTRPPGLGRQLARTVLLVLLHISVIGPAISVLFAEDGRDWVDRITGTGALRLSSLPSRGRQGTQPQGWIAPSAVPAPPSGAPAPNTQAPLDLSPATPSPTAAASPVLASAGAPPALPAPVPPTPASPVPPSPRMAEVPQHKTPEEGKRTTPDPTGTPTRSPQGAPLSAAPDHTQVRIAPTRSPAAAPTSNVLIPSRTRRPRHAREDQIPAEKTGSVTFPPPGMTVARDSSPTEMLPTMATSAGATGTQAGSSWSTPRLVSPQTNDSTNAPSTRERWDRVKTQTQQARPAATDGQAQRIPSLTTDSGLWLVLDSGQTEALVGPVALGRSPNATSPEARNVVVADPTRTLSRTHLLVGPAAEGIWVEDAFSANGTKLRLPDGKVRDLPRGVRVEAPVGTVILAGERSMTVMSNRA